MPGKSFFEVPRLYTGEMARQQRYCLMSLLPRKTTNLLVGSKPSQGRCHALTRAMSYVAYQWYGRRLPELDSFWPRYRDMSSKRRLCSPCGFNGSGILEYKTGCALTHVCPWCWSRRISQVHRNLEYEYLSRYVGGLPPLATFTAVFTYRFPSATTRVEGAFAFVHDNFSGNLGLIRSQGSFVLWTVEPFEDTEWHVKERLLWLIKPRRPGLKRPVICKTKLLKLPDCPVFNYYPTLSTRRRILASGSIGQYPNQLLQHSDASVVADVLNYHDSLSGSRKLSSRRGILRKKIPIDELKRLRAAACAKRSETREGALQDESTHSSDPCFEGSS